MDVSVDTDRCHVGDEAKGPLLFLISPVSDDVRGAVLPLNGGYPGP